MPKHRKTERLPHSPLRIDVTPDWKALTFEAFAEPALEILRIRLEREWTASRQPPARRGRPSLTGPVRAMCRQVWRDWGETFGDRTVSMFTAEVRKRFEKQAKWTHDAGRIAQHVRDWMLLNLYPEQYPKSYLRSRHGKGKAKLIQQRQEISRILKSGNQKEKEALLRNLIVISSPPSLAHSINLRPSAQKKTPVRSTRARQK